MVSLMNVRDGDSCRAHFSSFKQISSRLVKAKNKISFKAPTQNDFREDFGFVDSFQES